jgi:hypothetical protein
MNKFQIAIFGLASLAAGAASEAAPVKIEMSQNELKDFCDKKRGSYTNWSSGDASCSIGSGKSKIFISCNKRGCSTLKNNSVFTSNPSTHGAIGQAPVATLGNGAKNSENISGASGASIAGTAPANGASSIGASTTKKTPESPSSNTSRVGTGGLPMSGRPPLRPQ